MQKMAEARHYQIPLTPKPLPLTPRELNNGKMVPEAMVERVKAGLLAEGDWNKENAGR